MRDIALRGGTAPTTPPEDGSYEFAQPERAFLEKYEAVHKDKGVPDLGSSCGRINFQFNPKEVSITKSASWKRSDTKSKKAAPPEYTGPEPCKLTLELFFDASVNGSVDVVKSVDELFGCCVPYREFKKNEHAMPYLVIFNWGGVRSFAAYISQVQAKYTRFAANGTPIRAVCTVNLEEIDVTGYPPKQNPTSGALSADTVHTTTAGDRLPLIAYREYGDAELWRALAEYNGIDDPMRIPHGTRLFLPGVDALLAQVG